MTWLTNHIHALEMRLLAACFVFLIASIATEVVWLGHYAGMCAFFAIALIPLKGLSAIVDVILMVREDRALRAAPPN